MCSRRFVLCKCRWRNVSIFSRLERQASLSGNLTIVFNVRGYRYFIIVVIIILASLIYLIIYYILILLNNKKPACMTGWNDITLALLYAKLLSDKMTMKSKLFSLENLICRTFSSRHPQPPRMRPTASRIRTRVIAIGHWMKKLVYVSVCLCF